MRARVSHRAFVALALLTCTAASAARAQTCRPPKESNEARLLAFFATPIAFSPAGMVTPLAPWSISVAFDASYVPSPSSEIQQTDACYNIKKTENTDLSPVFPRPRVAVGLPGSLVLEASYLPPVTVADATPNLASVALSRPLGLNRREGGGGVGLLVRAHATFGRVRGPITCPAENLQQRTQAEACFGSRPSEDTYRPNMFGGEVALTTEGKGGRWGAYGGVGATWLRPRFQVGFEYQDGSFDDTRIEVDMTRLALLAGTRYHVARTAALTAELYSVPEDATTVRVGAAYLVQ